MDANSLLVFLLFLSALAIGYLLAKRPVDLKNSFKSDASNSRVERYRESLNYLIAEQPDAAIDALTATLDVNDDTLETHMALGAMLRKRGEVDRAIRIHQNVLTRSKLTQSQMLEGKLALAEDYLKAGLFDRAEALYSELSHEGDRAVAKQALIKLVDVYQSEGEWLQAVVAADAICQHATGDELVHWRRLQAQFYCEIAEQSLAREYLTDAKEAIAKARSLDVDLPRVVLLEGELALAEGRAQAALASLQQLPLNFTAHNAHVLPLLIDAYRAVHPDKPVHAFLGRLYEQQPSSLLLPAMAKAKASQSGDAEAIAFLVYELAKWPQLASLRDVLNILPTSTYGQLSLDSLLNVVEQRLTQTQQYDCQACGYEGHEHHWQCPSCKTWGSIVAHH